MRLEVGRRTLLEIESLAAGGEGIARAEGWVVFVPRTAPGDTWRVEIREVRRRYARARPIERLRAGPGRREPPCPYVGRCGGCDWMHLDEATQRRWRERILCDALVRIGRQGALPSIQTLASPAPFGYRSRARVLYARRKVGFRARRSQALVSVERCIVLDAATQRALDALVARPPQGRGEREIRGYGDAVAVAGRTLRVGPHAFFQANRALWSAWLRKVAELCGEGEMALELYAGVGFYTSVLMERFRRVIAVEAGPAAEDLAVNCAAEVVRTRAEHWLPITGRRLQPEVVLMNPPRRGCDARVVEALRVLSPRRIVYVSCDPTTLARDLAGLEGVFSLSQLWVLDALPQTSRIETIAVLERC
ncbi:MAG: class I SAM-dependent RNA methyltransferase [Myxococcota bacterium]